MDEKQINRAIGYGIVIIIGYYIVSAFIDDLCWVVVGLMVLQTIRGRNRR